MTGNSLQASPSTLWSESDLKTSPRPSSPLIAGQAREGDVEIEAKIVGRCRFVLLGCPSPLGEGIGMRSKLGGSPILKTKSA